MHSDYHNPFRAFLDFVPINKKQTFRAQLLIDQQTFNVFGVNLIVFGFKY